MAGETRIPYLAQRGSLREAGPSPQGVLFGHTREGRDGG